MTDWFRSAGRWLRRAFVTGFFLTVPMVISVVALVWLFQLVDGVSASVEARWLEPLLGRSVPGLGAVVTIVGIAGVGALATNVLGRRLLGRGQGLLLNVPVFRTIYAPVKQLIEAFSPANETGFKRVVMIESPDRGYLLGFLTKEFVVNRGQGAETLLAVYVPTNHLYLGDVMVCEPDRVAYPDLTVEQGIRIFLTGGMALPDAIQAQGPRIVGPAAR